MITESIMPNAHKAILKLLLDWVSLCPNDFKYGTSKRELLDFLNRVSMIGDHYRWLVDEIRIQAAFDVSVFQQSTESIKFISIIYISGQEQPYRVAIR